MPKGIDFAVECDLKSKISQSVQNVEFFYGQKEKFLETKSSKLLKIPGGGKFALKCDWISKISRDLRSSEFFF